MIVAVSGSTGPIYGVRLLEVLNDEYPSIEVHLILTAAARLTLDYEMGRDAETVMQLASVVHDEKNIGASVASGTFITRGMIVAPCSIKTLSAIAHSYNDTLISRAADVCLKERRPLTLLVRETPLHLGHLKMMAAATESGATVMPPSPAFYHRPQTIDDIVNHTVVKMLDLHGLHVEDLIKRWQGI